MLLLYIVLTKAGSRIKTCQAVAALLAEAQSQMLPQAFQSNAQLAMAPLLLTLPFCAFA